MRLLLLLLLPSLCLASETIITNSGDRFDRAEVTSHTPASITITHESGVATLPFRELPVELQTRYGYDSAAAQAWLAQVAAAHRKAIADAAQRNAVAKAARTNEARQRDAAREQLLSFVESGARLIYDPATGGVYFSEAEARLARTEAIKAALNARREQERK